MLRVFRVSEADHDRWNGYVRSNPDHHFYHDFRWKRVLSESFRHDAVYLAAEEDGAIVGIFPLIIFKSPIMGTALISLPYVNYGGMLADNDTVKSLLLEEAGRVSDTAAARYLESRGSVRSGSFALVKEHKVTMLLDVAGNGDAAWKALDPKVRNQVRKAEKEGLSVRAGGGELLDLFYTVYCRTMRDLGTPVIGKVFFLKMVQAFRKESSIFVVEACGRPVAAAFSFYDDGVFQVPWAGSHRSYRKSCPNELLYWMMIRAAAGLGARVFDFGRCTRGSGTYRFKKQWGAAEKPLYWEYRVSDQSAVPEDHPGSGKYAALVALWKRLPLCVANPIGPLVARYLTTF